MRINQIDGDGCAVFRRSAEGPFSRLCESQLIRVAAINQGNLRGDDARMGDGGTTGISRVPVKCSKTLLRSTTSSTSLIAETPVSLATGWPMPNCPTDLVH